MNLLFVEEPPPTLPILCSCSSQPFPGSLGHHQDAAPCPQTLCPLLLHPPGCCHPCVPIPVPRDTAQCQPDSPSTSSKQNIQAKGIQHLSAAANPSCREHLAQRLLLSGFLQGWISPHSPVAGSQRRFVGGIKQFPFICINPNPLAQRRAVGREGCLEQTCQELGREKRICI